MPGDWIDDLVDAFDATSTDSFRWLGRRESATPASGGPGRGGDQHPTAALIEAVERRLYRSFYSSGGPVDGVAEVALSRRRSPLQGDLEWVQGLSLANSGRGCWSTGWRLVEQRPSCVVVEKDGLRMRAPEGGWRRAPRELVDVLLQKEQRGLSPGFYLALGDRELDLRSTVIRIYWNLHPRGAETFVREGTRILNDADIGFRLKVPSAPADYDRKDAGVLYVDATAVDRLGPVVRGMHELVSPDLRDGQPAMTLRLTRGVALAVDPGGGASFGQHRCALLARGLVAGRLGVVRRGRTSRVADHRRVRKAVLSVLRRGGVDARRPFLPAGMSASDVLTATSWSSFEGSA